MSSSSKTTKIKIFYKLLPGKVVLNVNMPDNKNTTYEEIRKGIFEKTEKKKKGI